MSSDTYAGDEDPYRLIFSYTGHMKVPKWIDERNVKECFHCKDKMGSNEKHNCRLCGNVVCDRCSAKFHIPLVFELKGKKGTTRVCYGCRDSCIDERNREQAMERNPTQRGSLSSLVTSMGNLGFEIAPPLNWADGSKSTECKKCRKVVSKPRNCRLCGKCFCEKCTSKMGVPPAFERKQKSGPARVCDGCRYKVHAGARLVEKLSNAPASLPSSAPSSAQNSPSNRVSANKPGFFAAAIAAGANTAAANWSSSSSLFGTIRSSRKSTDVSTSNCITIKSEDGANTILARIPIASPTMTLNEIDRLFQKSSPQAYSYVYVYRQQIIPDTFFDMFAASQLGNVIHIRKKEVLDGVLLKTYEQSEPLNISATMASSSNSALSSNPWKSTENARQQEELAKKKEEMMKPKFHPPIIASPLKVDTVVKPFLTQTGSVQISRLSKNQTVRGSKIVAGANLVSVPAGKTVDDLFKMRAAQLFVAKV